MRKFVGVLAAALMLGVTGQALAANVIKYQAVLADPATCGTQEAGDNVSAHGYAKIADISGGFKVAKGDRLVYDILIPKESTLNSGAIDLFPNEDGPGTLRDSGAKDQYGAFAHPGTDYSKIKDKDGKLVFERGKWFHREIILTDDNEADSHFQDTNITAWVITFDEHDTTHKQDNCPIDKANGNVIFFIRNANFVGADGKVKKALYNGEDKFPDGQQKISGTNGGYDPPDTVSSVALEIVADPAP
jgi:hypothetical protein